MVKVEIYTRQLCGFCSAAKSLLKSKAVNFEEFDASFKPELKKKMIERANGRATFPQIFIDDQHIGGCDDLMLLEEKGKLDNLLGNNI
mgnify:CR=1 FL=1